MAIGKANLEMRAAGGDHFGSRHRFARKRPETARDRAFAEHRLPRRRHAATQADKNRRRQDAEPSRHKCPAASPRMSSPSVRQNAEESRGKQYANLVVVPSPQPYFVGHLSW